MLVTGEQTVHHRVGIAADGRCEVGVIVEAEAEVSDVVRRVFGLHHGTQGHALYQLALALAIHVVHQLVDALDHRLARAVGLHLQAEVDDELSERLHLLRIRVVVDTIGEHLGFLTLRHAAYALGNGTVGQQHELLNELVGILRALEVAACGVSLLIDIEVQFLSVKLHRAILEAALAQFLGQSVEGAQFPAVFVLVACLSRVGSRFAGTVDDTVVLQHLLCLLVGVAAVGADDGVYDT